VADDVSRFRVGHDQADLVHQSEVKELDAKFDLTIQNARAFPGFDIWNQSQIQNAIHFLNLNLISYLFQFSLTSTEANLHFHISFERFQRTVSATPIQ
jgi:hypothetical protein